ncbi:hypothetical protein LY78DRAFT_249288 [Colletotrichum sublineola]|nr:hypothetical protein LY78DRAFT_249288 [Colletotrichum sublineola]
MQRPMSAFDRWRGLSSEIIWTVSPGTDQKQMIIKAQAHALARFSMYSVCSIQSSIFNPQKLQQRGRAHLKTEEETFCGQIPPRHPAQWLGLAFSRIPSPCAPPSTTACLPNSLSVSTYSHDPLALEMYPYMGREACAAHNRYNSIDVDQTLLMKLSVTSQPRTTRHVTTSAEERDMPASLPETLEWQVGYSVFQEMALLLFCSSNPSHPFFMLCFPPPLGFALLAFQTNE